MKDQVLTIEQMQELINLGLDTSKAEFYWFQDVSWELPRVMEKDILGEELKMKPEKCTPTFSLEDILKMLPRELKPFEGRKAWKKVWLKLSPYAGDRWEVTYENPDELFYRGDGITPQEAAFEMLKYLKKNNYI